MQNVASTMKAIDIIYKKLYCHRMLDKSGNKTPKAKMFLNSRLKLNAHSSVTIKINHCLIILFQTKLSTPCRISKSEKRKQTHFTHFETDDYLRSWWQKSTPSKKKGNLKQKFETSPRK